MYLKRIAFLFLAFFSFALQINPAAAAFSIEYQASADPTTQGFSAYLNVPPAPQVIGPIANDLGYPAWSISGLGLSSQFLYLTGALNAAQKADINNQGFTLTLRARALQGNAPAYDAGSNTIIGGVALVIGSTHYTLELGINSSGNTVVVLVYSTDPYGPEGSVRAFGPSYTLNDAGYHTYDLVLNPSTQLASLFVDGVERISGYTGYPYTPSADWGLVFGALSGGGMNFNLVRLTSPAVVPGYQWAATGSISDCYGNDRAGSTAGAVPDPTECNAATFGLAAICWDRFPDPPFSAVCTYKSLTPAACVGGSRPGVVYECQSVQSTGLFGTTLKTASSHEFSLEQGTQKTEFIQLTNPGSVPRTATLEVINPHSDLTVSLIEPNPVSIAPGETKTLSINLDASTSPVGVYDDLLLKVTADDGSTLYASIKVNVTPTGTGELPDLTITANDIGSVTNADGSVTLTADIRNSGLVPAENVQVQFYEFGNALESPVVVAQIAPNGIGTASITVSALTAGDHLIRVAVDSTSAIVELDETNNEASRLITIGSSGPPTEGNILVTGSLPTTVYTGSLFTLSGRAVYDLYVNGVRYTNYVVKGGSVQITVGNAVYGDIHTDVNGNFAKTLQAPATPGTYHITMTVTDKTFVGTRDLTFKVEVPPPTPPSPPSPPPLPNGDGPAGTWQPGSSPGDPWIWIPTPGSGPAPASDLWVFSENIHLSKNNPAANEEITVFAEILYWAPSTALVAQDVPVNIYATYPGSSKVKIGEAVIPSLSVGSPDYGSRYVYATWKNQGDGIYLIEFEIDPSYVETNRLNNAATRAIIVGQITSQQGAISGQVTTSLGGVGGVMIHVLNADGMIEIGNAVTDATGFYLIANVPLGGAQVRIDPPSGYLPDAATKTVTVSNQEVQTVHFQLTWQGDTTPPVLNLPAAITTEATGPNGATVTFNVSATDDVDGAVTPTCTSNSGDTFALGTTTVTCTATDQARNTASGSFTVTVVDTTAPTLTVPGNLTAEATSSSGATVTFTATATDAVSGAITPSCDHISGSVFALGITTVHCSATDQANNTASGSFTVTVVDTTPPTVTVPADMTVRTTDPTGTNVSYSASAADLVDGTLTPVCTPASGSFFGPGTTEVKCSATDSRGNTGSAAFTVTVEIEVVVDRAPPLVSAVTAVPDAVPPNTEVTLTATVDDTTTGGSEIIAADYSVASGAWVLMSASDGAFDSPKEAVKAALTFPQVGTYQVCVRGTDMQGNTASSNCITVNVTGGGGGTNTAPILDPIGDQTVEEGKLLSLTITASDIDGDKLSFTASGLPTGASLTDHGDGTATLAWTPQLSQVGNYPVTITVTDDGLPPKSDSKQIMIKVTADAGQTAVLCSTLGNNTGRLWDEDVFRFEGTQGEQVVVTLTPNPNGSYAAGGAYLSLSRRNTSLTTDRSMLPNQIAMTLAVTSPYYRVSVMEYPPWVLRRPHFTGDYCITLKSSGNAYKTLRPEVLSVE